MAVSTILLAAFVVLVSYLIFRYRRFKAHYDNLPGLPDFRWTTGNVHVFGGIFNEEGITYFIRFVEKCPYICRCWVGPLMPMVFVSHPELFKIILKASFPKPLSTALTTSGYDMGLPWIGDGLLLANGDKWKRNRKLLTPAFHFDVLKSYMGIFNKTADVCLSQLEKVTKDGQSVNVQERMSLQSLDVLLQCAFSYQSNCQETGSEYVKAIQQLSRMWTERFENPMWLNDFIYSFSSHCKEFKQLCKFVHDVADEVITKRRKELENKPLDDAKGKDFLDTLLLARDEEGNGMDNKDIRNEVDTFMFEGHDTTAMALTFFLYQMALHPEHQEKCYQEVCDVMGDRDTVEWSDLSKLEYLTMCLKESFRLNNSIPVIGRTLDQEVNYRGYSLPKGTNIVLQIYVLHCNPAVWENPLEYTPDRFHPDKVKDMDPFQFLPFSAGSRNCIGQNFAMSEMKVFLPKMLKKFKVTLDETVEVRRRVAVAMTAENGVHLFLTPRDK